jgi:hypothetical protein
MSSKLADLTVKLRRFVEEECIPGEHVFDQEMRASANRWGPVPSVLEKLKLRAKSVLLFCLFPRFRGCVTGFHVCRELGLWNLWITKEYDHLIPAGAPGCGLVSVASCERLAVFMVLCEVLQRPRVDAD